MKQLAVHTAILICAAFTSNLVAQENDFINDFVERLENSKTYIIKVAELMPKEKYDFKASPESKSFAENLMHTAWALDWHSQSLLGGREARDWRTDTELRPHTKSKEEMIDKLSETFDKTIALLNNFDPSNLNDRLDYFGLDRTKRQIFLLLADHITHHRGQMLVSLRLNDIQPPRYIKYQ